MRVRSGVVLVLLVALMPATAVAREPFDLGGPIALGRGVATIGEVVVAANDEGYLLGWSSACEECMPEIWVRFFDASGMPSSSPERLENDGPVVSAAWIGERWVVLAGSIVHRFGADGRHLDRQRLPGRPIISGAVLVTGDDGALALWTVARPQSNLLRAARLHADGSFGDASSLDTDWPSVSVLGAWDGEAYWAWDGTRLLRIGGGQPAVERSVVLELPDLADGPAMRAARGCLGANGAGALALGWPAASGFRVQALDPSGQPAAAPPLHVGEGTLGERCAIVPDGDALRAFWDEDEGVVTRALGPDGGWQGDPADLPGPLRAVARGRDGYLEAWWSWIAHLDDGARVDACAAVAAPARGATAAWQSPPSVAWNGSAFRVVGQDESGVFVSGLVAADGLVEPWAETGIFGAHCHRMACTGDDWCALACFEDPVHGPCGQGGCSDGDPGGPAIGWLHEGRLAARVRPGPSVGVISDIERSGGGFVAVLPGLQSTIVRVAREEGRITGRTIVPRLSRSCSLAPDEEGELVGCVAPAESWIQRVHEDDTLGELVSLPSAVELELARAGDRTWAAWVDGHDGALRVAALSADGAIDGAPEIVAAEGSAPTLAPAREGVAVAFQQGSALLLGAVPAGGTWPVVVEASVAPDRPGWEGPPFGLGSGGGRLAVAYRDALDDPTVRLAPRAHGFCSTLEVQAPGPFAVVAGGAAAEDPRHLAGGGCTLAVTRPDAASPLGGATAALGLALALARRRRQRPDFLRARSYRPSIRSR